MQSKRDSKSKLTPVFGEHGGMAGLAKVQAAQRGQACGMSNIAKSSNEPTEIVLIKPDVNHVLMVAVQLQNRLMDYRDHMVLDRYQKQSSSEDVADFDHAADLAYWAENFAVSIKLIEIEQALMCVVGIRRFLDSWDQQQHADMHAALELIGKVRAFLNSRPSFPSIVTYGDDMFIKAWDETADDLKVNVVVGEGSRHGR